MSARPPEPTQMVQDMRQWQEIFAGRLSPDAATLRGLVERWNRITMHLNKVSHGMVDEAPTEEDIAFMDAAKGFFGKEVLLPGGGVYLYDALLKNTQSALLKAAVCEIGLDAAIGQFLAGRQPAPGASEEKLFRCLVHGLAQEKQATSPLPDKDFIYNQEQLFSKLGIQGKSVLKAAQGIEAAITSLEQHKDSLQSRDPDAAAALTAITREMRDAVENPPKDRSFAEVCDTLISDNRSALDTHRGCAGLLGKISEFLVSLGFKTASSKKLDTLRDTLREWRGAETAAAETQEASPDRPSMS